MHKKISHMLRNVTIKKLKQQIVKCLTCFLDAIIVQPSPKPSARALGSLLWTGTGHLY